MKNTPSGNDEAFWRNNNEVLMIFHRVKPSKSIWFHVKINARKTMISRKNKDTACQNYSNVKSKSSSLSSLSLLSLSKGAIALERRAISLTVSAKALRMQATQSKARSAWMRGLMIQLRSTRCV
jgi:squalene cyclase